MHDSTVTTPQLAPPSMAHRYNNFLTVCMTHAEVALESGQPAELEAALRWILEGAETLAPEQGSLVQHQLSYGDAGEEALRG